MTDQFLDKGVDSVLKKAGHGQNSGTTEKISDGIRGMFKKVSLPVLIFARGVQSVDMSVHGQGCAYQGQAVRGRQGA